MSVDETIRFTLNGSPVSVTVPVTMDALTMLRDVLKLTGTKYGCGEGECGACTILVDGVAVNSCLEFAVACDGRDLKTIEGIRRDGGLDELQQAFVEYGAVQCGFCTPGLVMQATYLMKQGRDLDATQIKRGIEGNLCRCTGYRKVVEAIATAMSRSVSGRKAEP